ncbi:MAG: PorP/SprF family type IX secretion system membrane protein [Bacteroidota bacterium]
MKTKAVVIILLTSFLFSWTISRSQDTYYSQFFNNPSYINPAFTGINTGARVRFAFRNLWPKLPVSYKSYFFAADIGDRGLPGAGGVGLYVNSANDGVAFIHDLTAGINVSVRVPFSELVESQVGMKVGFGQRSVSWQDFIFQDQLDLVYGIKPNYTPLFIAPLESKKVFPDFGAGGLLLFANSNQGGLTGTVGFAVDHMFQPDISFFSNGESVLSRKIILHGEVIFTGSSASNGGINDETLKLNPGFLYQTQAGLSTLQLGMNILKFNLVLGAWYKTALKVGPTSSMVLLAGYKYTFNESSSIKFAYSYDLQITNSLSSTGGAHEISLILEFGNAGLTGRNQTPSFSRGVGRASAPNGRKIGVLECSPFF